jgi:hypothetical protein
LASSSVVCPAIFYDFFASLMNKNQKEYQINPQNA